MPPPAFEGFRNHEDTHAVGLPENADYAALDVAITVHVRGLQTGPILVENQPLRIRQINWPSDGRSPTDALGSDLLEHTDASTSRPPTRKGRLDQSLSEKTNVMSCIFCSGFMNTRPNLMTQHAQIAERKYCRPHARPFRLGFPRKVPVFPICSLATL
jgi:hypothetical protein